MNMREYTIVGKIMIDNTIYYRLLSNDYHTFYLKDNNGSYDYLEFEEYLRVDNICKPKDFLYANDEEKTYIVTFSNEKKGSRPKVKTCDLVWFRKKLVSLTLAFAISASVLGLPTVNIAERVYFDTHITIDTATKYGFDVEDIYCYEEPIFTDYYSDDYKMVNIKASFINSLNRDLFPKNTGVLTTREYTHDYIMLTSDEFCTKMGINKVTYNDLDREINALNVDDSYRLIIHDLVHKMEELKLDVDLRILYYNLRTLKIDNKKDFKYDPFNNILSIDKNADYETMIVRFAHELSHIINNAYDYNTSYRVSTYQDVLHTDFSDSFIYDKNFGISLEEYKADLLAYQLTGKKINYSNSYMENFLFYFVKDKLNYLVELHGNKITKMSIKDLFNTLNDIYTPSNVEAFFYEIDNMDETIFNDYVITQDYMDTIDKCEYTNVFFYNYIYYNMYGFKNQGFSTKQYITLVDNFIKEMKQCLEITTIDGKDYVFINEYDRIDLNELEKMINETLYKEYDDISVDFEMQLD